MDHILKCHEIVKTDIVRGRGCYLYDVEGRRYIDFEAGVWCTALGHNHWRINEIIRRQIETMIHVGYRYTNDSAEEAAVQLLNTVGLAGSNSGGKCTFLSSGSEAVEFAVQTARRITGRSLLLTLSDSYLAAYGSAGRKSEHEWYSFDWRECVVCPKSDTCNPACSQFSEIPFERIGALVLEPGNSSGQVRLPPKALVRNLVEMVNGELGLLVVDEVTTGLGRTGAWYGFQHYDLAPDIIALGKGLGNGYPVSAVAMTHEIANALEEDGFRYAQSHQNDPLGCAVAKEVIAIIGEDGLVNRSAQVGTHFLRELRILESRHDLVNEVRGRGLMIAMEFVDIGKDIISTSLFRDLLDRGFLVGHTPAANLLRFYPPLTITEQDIAELLDSLDQILSHS